MTHYIFTFRMISRIFLILGVFICVLITGCASTSRDGTARPTQDTSGNESDQRGRARAHAELAKGYYEIGNLNVALEELQIALQADSNFFYTLNVAGLIHAALGDQALAEQFFNRAIRLNQTDPETNNNFGQFLCALQREEEGERYLLDALKNPLYKTPELALINLGICLRRKGLYERSEGYFQRALSMQPNYPTALYQLAELFLIRKELLQSQEYFRRLESLLQPTPELLWLGIWLHRQLDDRLSVASYSLQLRKYFPESREAADLQNGRFE